MIKHVYNLIIIGCLVAILFTVKRNATSMPVQTAKDTGIKIGKTYQTTEYKEVKATSESKDKVRHSTTFRSYMDTDSKCRLGVNHRIKFDDDVYVNAGIEGRQNSNGKEAGIFTLSVTRYW
jgi:hypothetical protein